MGAMERGSCRGCLVPTVMENLTSVILLAGGGSFMDSLPDPMKLHHWEIGFVVVLLVGLHFFLKHNLFGPLGRLMDDREAEIQAGALAKAEAAKAVEARQTEYAEKLKDLRAKTFEHRKALAKAADGEKSGIIENARREAALERLAATERLAIEREAAKAELTAQVDALAEGMALHLLKQV